MAFKDEGARAVGRRLVVDAVALLQDDAGHDLLAVLFIGYADDLHILDIGRIGVAAPVMVKAGGNGPASSISVL